MDTKRPPDFDTLVAQHRAALHAYCYRMLGSLHDAEDALQETLLGAWRGLAGFEGRSAVRSWLFRIATHACLHVIAQRSRRVVPEEYGPASTGLDVEARIDDPMWLEPYALPADAPYEVRESVELAFVAALQHLPATQRAALLLHEVLGYSAAEVAELLDTTTPAVNSALQRARDTVGQRIPSPSQQATLARLGADAERALVDAYVTAWGAGDVDGIVRLLTHDAKFTMPPIPTWFLGREAIGRFLGERVFSEPRRMVPLRASGQLAFACYRGPELRLSALNVVTLRDTSICQMTAFLDPAVHAHFHLPDR